MTGNRLDLTIFVVLAQTGTDDDGTSQSQPTTDGVNNGGTGEIDETESFQPATAVKQATPGPGTGDGIDNRRNKNRIDQISTEFGTLSYSTGDNRRSGGGKHGLEHPESVVPGFAITGGATEEEIGGAKETVGSAKHQTKPHSPETNGAD